MIIIAACVPTLRALFIQIFNVVHTKVSSIIKSHEKLSTPRDECSSELRTCASWTEPQAKNASQEAAEYGWPNDNGSQINIVPPNGILATREMDLRFEEGRAKDEEYGWSGSRSAISTNTVL